MPPFVSFPLHQPLRCVYITETDLPSRFQTLVIGTPGPGPGQGAFGIAFEHDQHRGQIQVALRDEHQRWGVVYVPVSGRTTARRSWESVTGRLRYFLGEGRYGTLPEAALFEPDLAAVALAADNAALAAFAVDMLHITDPDRAAQVQVLLALRSPAFAQQVTAACLPSEQRAAAFATFLRPH